ncbi:cell division protein FtsQ/DivIB [Stutzerimonas tarimensis]|uniref:Cell division protein FtsQ n=1 Tax=Stutzerimonas tarimensis TaxID=1507735 RepID=A0ABV7T276_9GAMM
MIPSLRHTQPFPRTPQRKVAPRGASRLVAPEPLLSRLPRPTWSGVKRVLWPVVLVGLLAAGYELGQQLLPYADRPIAKVTVQGELAYVSPDAVQQQIAPYVERSFFSVDLVGMRKSLEEMPWIAGAEARRVWPDQVIVKLDEQLPIARWGDEALLNNRGQSFVPSDASGYDQLPQLYGPKRAQRRVMQQYQMLSQMLRPMGLTVHRLELRERGSWFLTTGQGMELLLGRDNVVEKIRRFGTIYRQELHEQRENIARVDLRYANGLAVAWHEPPAAASDTLVAKKN